VEAIRLDLTSVEAVERGIDMVAETLGGIDAFVQCAGLGLSPGDPVPAGSCQRMEDVREAGWEEMVAVKVKRTFFACRRVAVHMRRAGGGNVVLLGSISGVKPLPSPVHYAACKGALVGMTQAMAKELGPSGIRVNLVAPGLLEDGVSRTLPQQMRDEYVKHCGLKRLGTPAEVARVVAWLARHNTYVTGQTILVDGALCRGRG